MSPSAKWAFRITADHLLDNLAASLYKSEGDCLWELIRNGVVACMPGSHWVPGLGHVEVFLVKDHPLAPKMYALVILDRGEGFTEPSIKRFCNIGRAMDDVEQSFSGAAQKRIGRFAALAQNERCLERDKTTGFYILTRTSSEGPVTYVAMIPELIEKDQGVTPRLISANSAELGALKGVKGSFTEIVIPYPVFKNHEEIRKALEYRIPRKQQQMFKLLVGGVQLNPPKLASRVTLAQQSEGIEVYVDKAKDGDSDGIWFTDADTGLRVAQATVLGPQHLPYPIFRHDLTGDIFVRGLLAHQDTARSSLNSKFLKSKAWRQVTAYLVGQVIGPCKALLGDVDVFGKDPISVLAQDIALRFNKAFGVPDNLTGPGIESEGSDKDRTKPRKGGHGGGGGGGGNGGGGSTPPTKQRLFPIKIGDQSFLLSKRSMDPRLLAEVDRQNGRVLWLNDRYSAMPKSREARSQHVIDMVLYAVGRHRHPDNSYSVSLLTGELLERLRK